MKSLLILGVLALSFQTFASSQTAMTLRRVNFYPEKVLHYDLVYDQANCQINTAAPFDVYYTNINTGARYPDFSQSSREYFGPKIDKTKVSATRAALFFKGLDEIQNKLEQEIEVWITIRKAGATCAASAEVTYADKRFVLKHIDLKLSKALGVPTGLDWVLLTGQTAGSQFRECLIGNCR